jgi:hypothetical protein
MCCVVLGLCLASCHAIALPGVDDALAPLKKLLPCLFECPCGEAICVPKLGLNPLAKVDCLHVTADLNLTCPSLAAQVHICCKAEALCYTSCGTLKTVCDVTLELCLIALTADIDLCKKNTVDVDLEALTAKLTLCDRYRDAQKYGCDCSDGTGHGDDGGHDGGDTGVPEVPSYPGGDTDAPSVPESPSGPYIPPVD